MAQAGQGADDEPMVIDGGRAGIAQSRHHPNAGKSAYAADAQHAADAQQRNDEGSSAPKPVKRPESSRDRIRRLVIGGKEEEFDELLGKLLAAAKEEGKRAARDAHAPAPANRADLTKLIEETVQLTIAKTTAPSPTRSWASVAGAPPTGHHHVAVPTVAVPARSHREVIVQAKGAGPDLTARSPAEMVQAVNLALGGDKAVAARRLRSGDTVVTFAEKAALYTQDEAWVEKAFGATAKLTRRTFAVVAKGVPTNKLKNALQDEKAFLQALRRENGNQAVVSCKPIMPKNGHIPVAAMVLHINEAESARALCEQGLLWEARYFDCEPYSPNVAPRQCYKCYGYGHIARFCERQARCGRCAAAAHPGGENACPTKGAGRKKTCLHCKGNHAAWDRRCPEAQKQWERARVAYEQRPRQFEIRAGQPVSRRDARDSEGFTLVGGGKRRRDDETVQPRGRPRVLARAPPGNRSMTEFTSRARDDAPQDHEMPTVTAPAGTTDPPQW